MDYDDYGDFNAVYNNEDFYDSNTDEPFADDYFVTDEVIFIDEYQPQQVSCLTVILAVAGVAAILIFALGRIGITLPKTVGPEVNISTSGGLGGSNIASLFTPEVQYWSSSIAQWSQQTGIDANLIATVMQIESCGDPFANSGAGAMGLFQVMPYHFESGEDPFKPATNAQRGLGYLQRALAAREGVVRLGLAGYNGGITGAKRPEAQWADETQRYVYWGTGIYEDTLNLETTSKRLDEWLERGGASLCKQAAHRLGIEE